MGYYKDSERVAKPKAMIGVSVHTCHNKRRRGMTGLGAYYIDVTPGSGEVPFRLEYASYEVYYNSATAGWDSQAKKSLEKLMLQYRELHQRNPHNWLRPLNNTNVAFTDNYVRRNVPSDILLPREIAALAYIEIMSEAGYILERSNIAT